MQFLASKHSKIVWTQCHVTSCHHIPLRTWHFLRTPGLWRSNRHKFIYSSGSQATLSKSETWKYGNLRHVWAERPMRRACGALQSSGRDGGSYEKIMGLSLVSMGIFKWPELARTCHSLGAKLSFFDNSGWSTHRRCPKFPWVGWYRGLCLPMFTPLTIGTWW